MGLFSTPPWEEKNEELIKPDEKRENFEYKTIAEIARTARELGIKPTITRDAIAFRHDGIIHYFKFN